MVISNGVLSLAQSRLLYLYGQQDDTYEIH